MNQIEHESQYQTPFYKKRAVLWTALFLCILPLAVATWFTWYVYAPGPAGSIQQINVLIPRGASVREIGQILADANLIEDDFRFILLTRITRSAGSLPAGEFSLITGQTPLRVLKMLRQARPVQHTVTVPEGLEVAQIAEIFAAGGWCEKDEYISLANEKAFIEKLGFTGFDSLEGYLFPDTYFLTRDKTGAEHIINLQVRRFRHVWGELVKEYGKNVTQREVVILASLVEKETANPKERPQIAAVFHNRLKRKMRLQSDPTVIYGIENRQGPITKKQLRNQTPYNTYIVPALPAGPIANPGKEALHAVLFPADTSDLYFVSKNDGSHQFSTNLRDHNRAVRKYQRKKKAKSGKQ